MTQPESGRRRVARRVPAQPANPAQECAHAVMQTVPVVMRAIRTEMRRNGAPLLSIPQVRTLAYLHRSPGSCLFPLAEHLGVTRPTASTIVERLVRRGMVSRAEDPRERRRVVLRLTPLGLQHFRRTRRATQEWMATVLSRLSEADLRRITKGITALRVSFDGAVHRDGHGRRTESPGDIRRVAQSTPVHGWRGAAAGRRRPQSAGS
jgi:DNA-binding MarR family transcriptional regulator